MAGGFNLDQKLSLVSVVLGAASLGVSILSTPIIDRLLTREEPAPPPVVVATPAPAPPMNAEESPIPERLDGGFAAVSSDSRAPETVPEHVAEAIRKHRSLFRDIGVAALAAGLAGLIWTASARRRMQPRKPFR